MIFFLFFILIGDLKASEKDLRIEVENTLMKEERQLINCSSQDTSEDLIDGVEEVAHLRKFRKTEKGWSLVEEDPVMILLVQGLSGKKILQAGKDIDDPELWNVLEVVVVGVDGEDCKMIHEDVLSFLNVISSPVVVRFIGGSKEISSVCQDGSLVSPDIVSILQLPRSADAQWSAQVRELNSFERDVQQKGSGLIQSIIKLSTLLKDSLAIKSQGDMLCDLNEEGGSEDILKIMLGVVLFGRLSAEDGELFCKYMGITDDSEKNEGAFLCQYSKPQKESIKVFNAIFDLLKDISAKVEEDVTDGVLEEYAPVFGQYGQKLENFLINSNSADWSKEELEKREDNQSLIVSGDESLEEGQESSAQAESTEELEKREDNQSLIVSGEGALEEGQEFSAQEESTEELEKREDNQSLIVSGEESLEEGQEFSAQEESTEELEKIGDNQSLIVSGEESLEEGQESSGQTESEELEKREDNQNLTVSGEEPLEEGRQPTGNMDLGTDEESEEESQEYAIARKSLEGSAEERQNLLLSDAGSDEDEQDVSIVYYTKITEETDGGQDLEGENKGSQEDQKSASLIEEKLTSGPHLDREESLDLVQGWLTHTTLTIPEFYLDYIKRTLLEVPPALSTKSQSVEKEETSKDKPEESLADTQDLQAGTSYVLGEEAAARFLQLSKKIFVWETLGNVLRDEVLSYFGNRIDLSQFRSEQTEDEEDIKYHFVENIPSFRKNIKAADVLLLKDDRLEVLTDAFPVILEDMMVIRSLRAWLEDSIINAQFFLPLFAQQVERVCRDNAGVGFFADPSSLISKMMCFGKIQPLANLHIADYNQAWKQSGIESEEIAMLW